MRILFINSSRTWGGGERWLADVCKGLQDRGHRVTVVCQAGAPLEKSASLPGVRVVPLRISGDFNPITIVKLYRLIKHHEIGLVCTNLEKDLRVGGIAALAAGVPIVPSREVDFPIKNTWLNKFFYKRVASAIMVNSYATLNSLLIQTPWLGKTQIEVVWKGVEIRRDRSISGAGLREQFRFSVNDRLVGFLGRLDEQKGIPTLLDAMRLVVARRPTIKLVLAGDGNLRPLIEEYRRSYKLAKHVYLVGFQENVYAFLKSIDFLVMPSYWEGFGYAAVEAMAVGKAVVATHTSSLPEIVKDGRTGILVPPRSPQQLAEAIIKLGANRNLCVKMGKEGKARAYRMFRLSSMVAQTESLFLRASATFRRFIPGEKTSPP